MDWCVASGDEMGKRCGWHSILAKSLKAKVQTPKREVLEAGTQTGTQAAVPKWHRYSRALQFC